MKDLVDIVMYATNESCDLMKLRHAVRSECAKRGMAVPERFAAPDSWRGRFAAYAQKNGLTGECAGFEEASLLASRLYDPALSGVFPDDAAWDPIKAEWVS